MCIFRNGAGLPHTASGESGLESSREKTRDDPAAPPSVLRGDHRLPLHILRLDLLLDPADPPLPRPGAGGRVRHRLALGGGGAALLRGRQLPALGAAGVPGRVRRRSRLLPLGRGGPLAAAPGGPGLPDGRHPQHGPQHGRAQGRGGRALRPGARGDLREPLRGRARPAPRLHADRVLAGPRRLHAGRQGPGGRDPLGHRAQRVALLRGPGPGHGRERRPGLPDDPGHLAPDPPARRVPPLLRGRQARPAPDRAPPGTRSRPSWSPST